MDDEYDQCGRMLEALHQSLSAWRNKTRTGNQVSEDAAVYGSSPAEDTWGEIAALTEQLDIAAFGP